jgi:hypothetical protein
MDEKRLLERLRAIEALHAGATTDGERTAAAEARTRIMARLAAERAKDPEIETTFTLRNPWSLSLFIALCRRYGLRPYRYYRQRRTTVNVKAPRTFVNETLWPEFVAIDRELVEHLSETARRVIDTAIHADGGEIDEIAGVLGASGPPNG